MQPTKQNPVKPDLKVWHIEETDNWVFENVNYLQKYPTTKIFSTYLIDENVNHHLCELRASKYGYYLGTYLELPGGIPEEEEQDIREKFFDLVCEQDNDNDYFYPGDEAKKEDISDHFHESEIEELTEALNADNPDEDEEFQTEKAKDHSAEEKCDELMQEMAADLRANGYGY